MPELPDIEAYLLALRERTEGATLTDIRIISPFLLRTVDPPYDALIGHKVTSLHRLGKRIVFELDNNMFAVIHLMISGRFMWSDDPKLKSRDKATLASFHFNTGTLTLVEAATQKRASLHVVQSEDALDAHNPKGLEPLTATPAQFQAAVTSQNRTLKRILTSPAIFSGIGNAFSDEILHAAKLSPIKLSQKLTPDEHKRLYTATKDILTKWSAILADRARKSFPSRAEVTAFRPEFAVHGKYGKPCPICGTAVQRIVHATNETNYCPRCQTDGKLLADRSLSRLLKDDWPATIEEWEESKRPVE
ncbi:MAG: DNA-formamidopyrimidine glycosylase family protein [Phycisphaerales bacterium]